MRVQVVVPWAPGCPHRERALGWVLATYAQRHPGWLVTVAEAAPGTWCKAAAVTPAIEASTADVVIVADADVFTDGLGTSVQAISAGGAWTQPHRVVHRLTPEATDALIAGHQDWQALPTVEPPYRGVDGGGIVVARRQVLQDCPLDPRFTGWGQEDVSWAVALRTLHGHTPRGTARLVHLWHPPQQRTTRKVGSAAGQALHRRYIAARRDPRAMRALIQETTPCHSPSS